MVITNRVEREIEVSHWGNIAIEEAVNARNSGTPLTGEFSRLDYYRSDPDLIPAWGIPLLFYFILLYREALVGFGQEGQGLLLS